ncbi:protein kinase domain-containing protein [Bifidobacterium platyrrhinorum]|uniref:non-specific serine/threonine protein kinase n=1 Tax=Bifidobacterium platyrrhinorum TaxID=2661628 RepID=A0A6L9SPU1_9BIFI|nr:PASTA domain-containing protein [Bifidobacterium platyrrhinorum]NEG54474.1 PASTA domain-containing protein [Bifidobacterium platyrrhinorum]
MSEAANAPEGQLIEGRYRIVRRIAQGGMATVYEAQDERLGRMVAIKVMHTQLAQGPHRDQFIERFRREARSAARIANPHIVQVYDTGEFNGLAYLVMEYVHGVNLRHEMNQQGTFTVRETLRIVSETLDGLSSAHQVNVVHRDIKPENIMLNDRGRVQITDFGLAKATSQATLSSTGMLLGTAAYLPPETIERNEATPQGDLYAVGIMAWEMLAGEVPFISDNPVTLVFKHVHEDVPSVAVPCPGIDPSVARFIAHLTARSIDARPADATAALSELREVMRGLSVQAWQYRKPDEHPDDETEGETTLPGSGRNLMPPIGARLAGAGLPPAPPADAAPATVADASGVAGMTAGSPVAAPAGPQTSPTTPPAPPSSIQPTTAMSTAATQVMRPAPEPAATQALDLLAFADDAAPARTTSSLPGTTSMPMADQPTQTMPATQGTTGVGRPPSTPAAGGGVEGTALPTASPGSPVSATTGKATPSGKSRKGRRALIIALVTVLVLALAGGGGGAWWYYLGPGSYWELPKPDDVTCEEGRACTLEGAVWKSYESTLKVTGIPYKTSTAYSDTVEKGRIILATLDRQDAEVNAHVSKRHTPTLRVVVSRGVKMATIPKDILDPNSADGKAPLDALKNAGFTNVKHDESQDVYSETLPEGAALTITPDPGTTLKHNAEITVALSKGPMPVTMPDIVGRTKDEAAQAMDDLKLKANWSEEYSDTVESGKVISSSVAKDTQLHWGDSVDVVVSKGPEMVTVPDVRGKTYEEASKTLQALGLQVKKSAPLGDVTHTVRLQSPDPGQQVRVRDANGNKTVITLTVV